MAQKKPTAEKKNEVNGLDQGQPARHSEKAGFPFFYLRLRMVCEITGLSKTTVYKYSRNDPDFPKPVKLGATCTAWRSDELAAWMDSRPRALMEGMA